MMTITSTYRHQEPAPGEHESPSMPTSPTSPKDHKMSKQSAPGLRRITLTPERMARKPIFPKTRRLPVRSSPKQPEEPETLRTGTPEPQSRAVAPIITPGSKTSHNFETARRSMPPYALPTEGSMYCGPHFDACTFDAMDHKLACGHKILTAEPEPCANNCHAREPPDYAQPRDLDQSFVCMSCIGDHIHTRQVERYTAFKIELENVAAENDKPREWVMQKLDLMAMAWQDEDVEEIKMLSSKQKGKPSQPFWIEPELQGLVDTAMKENRLGRRSSRSTLNDSGPGSPTLSTASLATSRRESKPAPLQGSLRGLRNWHSRHSSNSSITTDTTRDAMKPPEDSPHFPIDKRKDSRTSGIPIWMEPQLPETATRTIEVSPRHDVTSSPPHEKYFVKPWHEQAPLRPYERKWLSEGAHDYE
ncbi:hypothetical protein AC578_10410 [Pseudocercospora eumusae]|uniref:Uncharacterized protein n=1 Tax=Pseudocercospora eumusae TaxID=321146 RepID=A0A139HB92_9PEZI|nr:hypothetical protein AC578_10410 [Pseudocercospora eumusae]